MLERYIVSNVDKQTKKIINLDKVVDIQAGIRPDGSLHYIKVIDGLRDDDGRNNRYHFITADMLTKRSLKVINQMLEDG